MTTRRLRRWVAPRHDEVVRTSGRALSVAVPAFAFMVVAGHGSWAFRLGVAVLQTSIWVVAVCAGYGMAGPALTALGPRIAIGRGVLLGVLGSAAADAFVLHSHESVPPLLVPACVVFATGAFWETFALRHVTPAARILVVGSGKRASALLDDVREGRGGGYEVIGVVHDGVPAGPSDRGVPVLGGVADLTAVIGEHHPDIVVLSPGRKRPETLQRLLDAAAAGFRVVDLPEFYEYAYGRVPVEDLPRAWFLGVLHLYRRPYSRLTKRTVDIVGASLLLALTLPLLPIVAFLVMQSEGPVLIRQLRLGEHGLPFTIYKFRTMRADAEMPGQAVWASAHDPRLTREGAVLRRLRLDELPQLWNVLRGEMSLVGPRPERPEFLEELTARVPYWTRRHLVKPGVTGWAQVRQGYAASAEATSQKLSYDLWYLRHCSLTVDLAILLRTVAVVLRGDRAAREPKKAAVAVEQVAVPAQAGKLSD